MKNLCYICRRYTPKNLWPLVNGEEKPDWPAIIWYLFNLYLDADGEMLMVYYRAMAWAERKYLVEIGSPFAKYRNSNTGELKWLINS